MHFGNRRCAPGLMRHLAWETRSQRLTFSHYLGSTHILNAFGRIQMRSSVKFPQSVMVWGAMSSAGVGPLCFLRSKVNTTVYQEVLKHFMLPAADQLYGDADFIFQQDLAPAHSAKATSTWIKDHGIHVLNWPANSPDLNLQTVVYSQLAE